MTRNTLDQLVQQHRQKREALIAEEQRRRHDYTFRQSLSPTAAKACQIVANIRQHELQDIWTKAENAPPDEILHPDVMFNLAKDRMQTTDLLRVVQRMPKGSLLHAHIEAMFNVDDLIEQCLATPGMHIHSPGPIISEKDLVQASFEFQYSSGNNQATGSIWSADYVPDSLIPVQKAATSFPNGGPSGFRTWVKSRCVILADQTYDHRHGLNAIWDVFKRIFPVVVSMIFYEPIFRHGFRRLLNELATDGIQYVEFRMGTGNPFQREGKDSPDEDHSNLLQVFQDEIHAFQQTERGRNFYGARIIATTPRRFSDEALKNQMRRCIQAKQAFPDLICGFDFVGQEDQGRTLIDLVPALLWFRQECSERGVDIPFFFHAGECLGDGDATDHNLYDAVLLNPRRIGHGFSLYKHPKLIEMINEQKIMIECCPISNEILRLTTSIKTHSLPALLARDVAVSLSNDDPAILGHGQNGLTQDFWQTLQGLESVGLAGLADMALNSIKWSCYEDQSDNEWERDLQNGVTGIKAQRLTAWYEDFERFCQMIVDEFGHYAC